MTRDRELCHCGEPLHYVDPTAERSVRRLIDELGPNIMVSTSAGTFAVPRHYVALHGLEADEVPHLGFERVA